MKVPAKYGLHLYIDLPIAEFQCYDLIDYFGAASFLIVFRLSIKTNYADYLYCVNYINSQ